MSLELDRGTRTAAAPYLHEWAGAIEDDLTDAGTDAPLVIPDFWTMGADTLVLTMGVASTTVTSSWSLICTDKVIRPPIVVGVITAAAIHAIAVRAQEVDGTSTINVYQPITFDLRQIPNHSKIQLFLALSVSSGAAAKYLIDWSSFRGRPV